MTFEALSFAREAHKAQVCKYTGAPYLKHLTEVAGLVATVTQAYSVPPQWLINAALLHDCMEDQGVTHEQLKDKFGAWVADAVLMLSDMETGNRAQRKAASRLRLSSASPAVQTIKCADLISNTSTIALHDPKFTPIYLAEKRALLEVLTAAHPGLRAIAWAQCNPHDKEDQAEIEKIGDFL